MLGDGSFDAVETFKLVKCSCDIREAAYSKDKGVLIARYGIKRKAISRKAKDHLHDGSIMGGEDIHRMLPCWHSLSMSSPEENLSGIFSTLRSDRDHSAKLQPRCLFDWRWLCRTCAFGRA